MGKGQWQGGSGCERTLYLVWEAASAWTEGQNGTTTHSEEVEGSQHAQPTACSVL